MTSKLRNGLQFIIAFSLAVSQISMVCASENDAGSLTVGNMIAISGLDPAREGSILSEESLIVETLVAIDQEYNLKPWLAVSWSQTDDRTWTFKLRDDLFFHDGSKMTASDVKFSLQRAAEIDSRLKVC